MESKTINERVASRQALSLMSSARQYLTHVNWPRKLVNSQGSSPSQMGLQKDR